MIKEILAITTIILLTGCNQVTKNTVSYKYAECVGSGDVGIVLKGNLYVCIDEKTTVKRYIPIKKKEVKQVRIKKGECETEITAIYKKSKHIGKKSLIICEGKLLEDGQKSRIVYK